VATDFAYGDGAGARYDENDVHLAANSTSRFPDDRASLRNCEISIEVIQPLNNPVGGHAGIQFWQPGFQNYLSLSMFNDFVLEESTEHMNAALPFAKPAGHRFLRICHDGTLYSESSGDGVQWMIHHIETTPTFIDTGHPTITVGT